VPTLAELQKQFAAALFDGQCDAVAAHIRDDGIGTAARLDIYGNNLREGFRKALALEFPVIERLVGGDYFRQLAREFQTAHPSRHGDLHFVGGPFAPYLRERYHDSEYSYLSDVAALEWAWQEAFCAADAQPLQLATVAAVDPGAYGQLRFLLHPSCRLLQSPYPIVRIWRSNQPEAGADERIDLGSGAERLLVMRTASGVEFHALDQAHYGWLEALARHATLSEALEIATALQADFDLGAALRRYIGNGAITALYPDSDAT
jgi:hypothetical protein